MTRISGVWNLSIGSKGPYLLIRPLDLSQTFREVVFLRVAIEWLLGEEDVWSIKLDHMVKRAIPFDPTVGSLSNFYIGCFP